MPDEEPLMFKEVLHSPWAKGTFTSPPPHTHFLARHLLQNKKFNQGIAFWFSLPSSLLNSFYGSLDKNKLNIAHPKEMTHIPLTLKSESARLECTFKKNLHFSSSIKMSIDLFQSLDMTLLNDVVHVFTCHPQHHSQLAK